MRQLRYNKVLLVIIIATICCTLTLIKRYLWAGSSAEEVNLQRIAHLRTACRRLNNAIYTHIFPAFYLYDKEHSLVYCTVFKAGTSSWLYNFNTWAGYDEHRILSEDNLSLARSKYPVLSEVKLLQAMLQSFSFLVVRDPFERLISGYEDRLLRTNNTIYRHFSRQLYAKYHSDGNATGEPSFRDFVRHIVEQTRTGVFLDLHWQPINSLCSPCFARYDAILKMETYDRDVQLMLGKAHLASKVTNMHMNSRRQKPVVELIKKYFSEITRQQFEDLYQIYRLDFELFDYSIEKYREMLEHLW